MYVIILLTSSEFTCFLCFVQMNYSMFMIHLFIQWEVKAPVPSTCFRNICKQVAKLHEAIVDLLPPQQILVSISSILDRISLTNPKGEYV